MRLINADDVLSIVDDLRDRMTVEGYCAMIERVKALATNLQQTCNLASKAIYSELIASDTPSAYVQQAGKIVDADIEIHFE